MTTAKDERRLRRESDEVDMIAAARRLYPNLVGLLSGGTAHRLQSVKVLERDDGTWLAVCVAAQRDDDRRMVTFGGGHTPIAALGDLARAIASNRWKEDRPLPVAGFSQGRRGPPTGGDRAGG